MILLAKGAKRGVDAAPAPTHHIFLRGKGLVAVLGRTFVVIDPTTHGAGWQPRHQFDAAVRGSVSALEDLSCVNPKIRSMHLGCCVAMIAKMLGEGIETCLTWVQSAPILQGCLLKAALRDRAKREKQDDRVIKATPIVLCSRKHPAV